MCKGADLPGWRRSPRAVGLHCGRDRRPFGGRMKGGRCVFQVRAGSRMCTTVRARARIAEVAASSRRDSICDSQLTARLSRGGRYRQAGRCAGRHTWFGVNTDRRCSVSFSDNGGYFGRNLPVAWFKRQGSSPCAKVSVSRHDRSSPARPSGARPIAEELHGTLRHVVEHAERHSHPRRSLAMRSPFGTLFGIAEPVAGGPRDLRAAVVARQRQEDCEPAPTAIVAIWRSRRGTH